MEGVSLGREVRAGSRCTTQWAQLQFSAPSRLLLGNSHAVSGFASSTAFLSIFYRDKASCSAVCEPLCCCFEGCRNTIPLTFLTLISVRAAVIFIVVLKLPQKRSSSNCASVALSSRDQPCQSIGSLEKLDKPKQTGPWLYDSRAPSQGISYQPVRILLLATWSNRKAPGHLTRELTWQTSQVLSEKNRSHFPSAAHIWLWTASQRVVFCLKP